MAGSYAAASRESPWASSPPPTTSSEPVHAATIEDNPPRFLKGTGLGWVTAEYGMLPRATLERTRREAAVGKQGGRTVEIQRLIGRSLRAAIDLEALGERQITVDCDVIQADGGTRTASITGAWVALADCIAWMKTRNMLKATVLRDNIAAISCGIYQGTPVLDLDYAEDSEADTDAITESVLAMTAEVARYVPGYTLRAEPQFDPPNDTWPGWARVALFLEAVRGGVTLTPRGRLPRTVVRSLQEQHPDWHWLAPEHRLAHREEDLRPLAALHDLCLETRLVQVRRGVLAPTAAALAGLGLLAATGRGLPAAVLVILLALTVPHAAVVARLRRRAAPTADRSACQTGRSTTT